MYMYLEKKREDPPVTHRVKPKHPDQVKLYWPREERTLWTMFVKAMERDGSSASEYIRAKIHEWAGGHAPGNPQTPLEKYGVEQCTHAWAWVPIEDTTIKRWACVSCGTRGPLEELQNR